MNKNDYKEINLKKEVIYLTEEEILSIVDSNNAETPV